MTYDLFIGDRTFSSWSLRAGLMMAQFDLPHRIHMVGLYSGTMAKDLAPLAPARLVPVLRTPEGDVIGESLAIAETLAERHPEKRCGHKIQLCAYAPDGSAPRWRPVFPLSAKPVRCSCNT